MEQILVGCVKFSHIYRIFIIRNISKQIKCNKTLIIYWMSFKMLTTRFHRKHNIEVVWNVFMCGHVGGSYFHIKF